MTAAYRRVVVESPYAGHVELHLRYLRACLADCLRRGEAPVASHGLYTQPGVLDDAIAADREAGIAYGFAWREVADATVVYVDLGITEGMRRGIADASRLCRGPVHDHGIEIRTLGNPWQYGRDEQKLAATGEFATARWSVGDAGNTESISAVPGSREAP